MNTAGKIKSQDYIQLSGRDLAGLIDKFIQEAKGMDEKTFTDAIALLFQDFEDSFHEEVKRLFNCGGVDPAEFGGDFRLAKIIMTVALRNLADQYSPAPFQGAELEAIKNLSNF